MNSGLSVWAAWAGAWRCKLSRRRCLWGLRAQRRIRGVGGHVYGNDAATRRERREGRVGDITAETISGFRHLESDRVGWFKDGSWLKELP